MRKKIWKYLRRRLLRMYVRINRSMANQERLSETQKHSTRIIRKILVSEDSDLMIAPLSGIFYLCWKEVYVKIEGETVEIINGKYYYNITLTTNQSKEIQRFFNRTLENRTHKMEAEITERTNKSLLTILKDLDNN